MSKLVQPKSNNRDLGPIPSPGVYLAVCLEVTEQLNVERRKYDNPQETESLDLVRFVFGLRGENGQCYKVRTWDMRISGSPKSKLWGFLSSWLGRPPEYGWDFGEMKGQGAMITVEHRTNRGGTKTFANVAGVVPVLGEVRSNVPSIEDFEPIKGSTRPPAPPSREGMSLYPSVGADDDVPF